MVTSKNSGRNFKILSFYWYNKEKHGEKHMNKILLFEAIRQSNLHPTTKSFLAQVLKGVDDMLENVEGAQTYEGPTGMLPLTGTPNEDDETYIPTDEELQDVFGSAGSPMPKQVTPFNPNSQTPEEKQAWLRELVGPPPRS